jgi:hypothetical protein
VLINIVKRVEQLAGVDQRVYWCESTLFKLADVGSIPTNDLKKIKGVNIIITPLTTTHSLKETYRRFCF